MTSALLNLDNSNQYLASNEVSSKHEEHYQAFLSALKDKNYFDGLDANSEGYKNKETKAKQKFLKGLAELYKDKGNALLTQKDAASCRSAISLYEVAIKLSPSHTYYNNMATAHYVVKQYKDSAEASRNAILLDPKFAKAYLRLAMAQEKLGEYDDAILNYDKSNELAPSDATLKLKQDCINAKQTSQ
ncbi:Sgt [Acrasis kona]|uniref:Sgt n=1 Tax=Acrasis kona TaxID=1008807 RepID=A0AAW2ZEI1_9EUKA